jgi:hypothetical protein
LEQGHDRAGVLAMILEDDIILLDPNLVDIIAESLKMVASDWVIIQLDCWGLNDFDFQ